MPDINGKEGVDFKYSIRRSRRAKNILLQVDISGEVEVVLPQRLSAARGEEFLISQREWIRGQLKKKARLRAQMPRRLLKSGVELPLLGAVRKLDVRVDQKRQQTRYVDGLDYIRVFVRDQEQVKIVLERWYKREARDYFAWRVPEMAGVLRKSVRRVVVSSATSQWGSCSAGSGRISLRWQLVLAPQAVADYVIAHEVAHLVEANHSMQFWRQVARLQPDFEKQRKWLKERGHALTV